MRNTSRNASSTILAAAVLLIAATSAAAQGYKVETLNVPPPEELAPVVRETLAGEVLRVTGPNGPLCEIWLRKVIPAKAKASEELGIAYAQLEEGSLIGTIRFLTMTRDFRRQQVRPGIYTLRYSLYPTDGAHMGVSPFRDFLLIAPAALDTNIAPVPFNDLMALTKKASTTSHASPWGLLKTEGEQGTLPSITHAKAEDHWILHFRAQVQPAGGVATPIVMSLIVAGYAPEA